MKQIKRLVVVLVVTLGLWSVLAPHGLAEGPPSLENFSLQKNHYTYSDSIVLTKSNNGWAALSLKECARLCLSHDLCGMFIYSASGNCRFHQSSAIASLKPDKPGPIGGYNAYIEGPWGKVAKNVFAAGDDPNRCFGWPANRSKAPFPVPFNPSKHLYAYTDTEHCSVENGGPGCVTPPGTNDFSLQCRQCTLNVQNVSETLPECPVSYSESIDFGEPDQPK